MPECRRYFVVRCLSGCGRLGSFSTIEQAADRRARHWEHRDAQASHEVRIFAHGQPRPLSKVAQKEKQ